VYSLHYVLCFCVQFFVRLLSTFYVCSLLLTAFWWIKMNIMFHSWLDSLHRGYCICKSLYVFVCLGLTINEFCMFVCLCLGFLLIVLCLQCDFRFDLFLVLVSFQFYQNLLTKTCWRSALIRSTISHGFNGVRP